MSKSDLVDVVVISACVAMIIFLFIAVIVIDMKRTALQKQFDDYRLRHPDHPLRTIVSSGYSLVSNDGGANWHSVLPGLVQPAADQSPDPLSKQQ